jgi:hypothetical protein
VAAVARLCSHHSRSSRGPGGGGGAGADASAAAGSARGGVAAVASFSAALLCQLAEIYLCDVCSCQEMLRRNGRGQAEGAALLLAEVVVAALGTVRGKDCWQETLACIDALVAEGADAPATASSSSAVAGHTTSSSSSSLSVGAEGALTAGQLARAMRQVLYMAVLEALPSAVSAAPLRLTDATAPPPPPPHPETSAAAAAGAPGLAPLWINVCYFLARDKWKAVLDTFSTDGHASMLRGEWASMLGALLREVLHRFQPSEGGGPPQQAGGEPPQLLDSKMKDVGGRSLFDMLVGCLCTVLPPAWVWLASHQRLPPPPCSRRS